MAYRLRGRIRDDVASLTLFCILIEVVKPRQGRWAMVFICDGCETKLSLMMVSWAYCMEQAKGKGWQFKKVYDVWRAGCPECVKFRRSHPPLQMGK